MGWWPQGTFTVYYSLFTRVSYSISIFSSSCKPTLGPENRAVTVMSCLFFLVKIIPSVCYADFQIVVSLHSSILSRPSWRPWFFFSFGDRWMTLGQTLQLGSCSALDSGHSDVPGFLADEAKQIFSALWLSFLYIINSTILIILQKPLSKIRHIILVQFQPQCYCRSNTKKCGHIVYIHRPRPNTPKQTPNRNLRVPNPHQISPDLPIPSHNPL